jgi:penicillin amidase
MLLRWTRRGLLGLLALLLLTLLAALALYLGLRGSLPALDGEQRLAGLTAPVEMQRDARGYLTVRAETRNDAARALGFAHAQDRFFQMDLLRRNAAGELAALVGAKALPLDQKRRMHRFRWRAERALAALAAPERALLQAYAEGVNAGLAALAVRPFEYLLLRQKPAPWLPQDSLLGVLSMYLDLQREGGAAGELAAGELKTMLGSAWYAFMRQHSADWSAALDESVPTPVPVPAEPWPLRGGEKLACRDCGFTDGRDIGSNNFAVGQPRHGAALVANDMHLGIRVPNTWYKAQLRWRDASVAGGERVLTGLSLPGMPAIVVGSNGRIAWGFTNSTADWSDLVALKLLDGGKAYASPAGPQPFVLHQEIIEVAGAAAVTLEVRETQWGPVLPAPFEGHALRWVAHDLEGLNLGLLALERAESVPDALRSAQGTGMPAQNLMVGDAQGQIAWTLIGAIPQRRYGPGADMDTPQDWSSGATGWDGYLPPGAAAWPAVVPPPDRQGRLWSANARLVGGEALALLGDGGYDLGARGWQIREGLRALQRIDERELHALQLDDRALLLARWRRLLLDEVLTPDFVARHGLADYRRAVETSAEAARVDAVGYTWVRAFRERLLEQLFAPLAARLEARQLKLRDLKWSLETPGWTLIQARRADLLPPGQSWAQAFERAVLDSRQALLDKTGGRIEELAWGWQNRAAFKHPLGAALPPLLARQLDLPESPLAGDSHMPRVQRSVHGQSQRMVVAPGREITGILSVPGGQSGHPLSPFFRGDHEAWLKGQLLPFLPDPEKHRLDLKP